MAPPILTLKDINLHWGADPVLDELELAIGNSDRICLLGRNGAGKSTLLKLIAGLIKPDDGKIWIQPGSRITYLEQAPDASGYETLHDFVVSGLPADEQDQDYRADTLLMELGVAGTVETASASGGELRRAALARAMVGEPDLLLLDEPTNHLDIATIEWLEGYLRSWRGAFVIISHDRTFLKNLTSACLWLDRGKVNRLDGGFDKFDAWQAELLEQETLARHKFDRLIKEEARWSVEGISARRKRNMGRMRRLADMREERRNQIKQTGSVKFQVEGGKSSGARVFEAKGISKTYDGRTLFSDFSMRISRGDKIGVIGSNGVGKSTMLKVLMGELEPDTGNIRRGTNLQPIWIDQKRSALDSATTVKDTLTGGRGDYVQFGERSVHFATYMKDFLFDPSQAKQPVSALSGGERNRLLLAAHFAKPSNLMVLDEPTNDLDMDTLDLLQEVLSDYSGTVLLVSHDRDFLDRIVTSSIVLEGDGTAIEYAGGYSDYIMQKKQAKKEQAAAIASDKKVSKIGKSKQNKKRGKLSYNDQRSLDNLPAEIEGLNTEIAQIEAELADPKLYSSDPDGFSRLNTKLTQTQETLEGKELRWLELEELKDQLGS